MSLVSIIVPCFNVADHIHRTLGSLTGQSYTKLEIILVDDGNAVSLEDLIADQIATDKRIKIVRHAKNLGLSNSRNTGLKQAKGEYILFWDADDYLNPDTVKTLLELAEKNNSEIVRGVLARTDGIKRWITKRGRHLLKNAVNTHFKNSPELTMDFTSCGVLFSKSFLQNYKLDFEPNLYMQDILFSSKALLHAEKICMTDHIVGDYLQSPQSASNLRTEKRFNSLFTLYEKLQELFEVEDISMDERNTIFASFINAGVNTFLLWKLEELEDSKNDLSRLSNLLSEIDIDAINQYCLEMLDEPSYLRLHAIRLKKYRLAQSASGIEQISDDSLHELYDRVRSESVNDVVAFLSRLRSEKRTSAINSRLLLDGEMKKPHVIRNIVRKLLSSFRNK